MIVVGGESPSLLTGIFSKAEKDLQASRTAEPQTVAQHRERLRQIAESIRAEREGRQMNCARSREWAKLPDNVRMCIMLLAGLDGDLGQLAKRQFAEFTLSEKGALQVAIRALHEAVNGAYALRVRAG